MPRVKVIESEQVSRAKERVEKSLGQKILEKMDKYLNIETALGNTIWPLMYMMYGYVRAGLEGGEYSDPFGLFVVRGGFREAFMTLILVAIVLMMYVALKTFKFKLLTREHEITLDLRKMELQVDALRHELSLLQVFSDVEALVKKGVDKGVIDTLLKLEQVKSKVLDEVAAKISEVKEDVEEKVDEVIEAVQRGLQQ